MPAHNPAIIDPIKTPLRAGCRQIFRQDIESNIFMSRRFLYQHVDDSVSQRLLMLIMWQRALYNFTNMLHHKGFPVYVFAFKIFILAILNEGYKQIIVVMRKIMIPCQRNISGESAIGRIGSKPKSRIRSAISPLSSIGLK